MTVAHRGVGVDDPDLQATFDDPVHLTIPPGSWEEMECQENERQAKLSSNSDGSLQKAAGIDIFSTPKRKNTKQHKRAQKEGSSSSDSSSSTSVENMERTTDMEQKMIQLYEIVGNMATRLATCVENQVATESALRAIAGLCHDNTTRTVTQGAAIKSLQAQTGEIAAQGATLRTLQAQTGDMQQQIAELKLANENCGRRISAAGDSIENLVTSHDNIKRGMDRRMEQAQHAGATPTGEGASSTDSCETGIFLSGIQQFMEIFDMRNTTDPFAVAGRLMYEIGLYGAINRVFVADRAVDRNERYKARAVIIYFNSTFHKRQAVIELKKFLQANSGLRATVSDVFPAAETPRALALTRYAADKKSDKNMTRTRVVNKSGSAVLQHREGASKRYQDSAVTEADLKPYYQAREGGARVRQTDRRERNKNERELRDQERAARRNSNRGDQFSSSDNQEQLQHQQPPQRTGNPQRRASPPLRVSTPNRQTIGKQQLSSVNMPRGNQQQQHYTPQQQLLYDQQQVYTSITHLQQPQLSNMQQAYYDNNILASHYNSLPSQGANGPPVNPANPMPHGFIQMPQNLLPFIQQQVY
jgi:hypothetical protein